MMLDKPNRLYVKTMYFTISNVLLAAYNWYYVSSGRSIRKIFNGENSN